MIFKLLLYVAHLIVYYNGYALRTIFILHMVASLFLRGSCDVPEEVNTKTADFIWLMSSGEWASFFWF